MAMTMEPLEIKVQALDDQVNQRITYLEAFLDERFKSSAMAVDVAQRASKEAADKAEAAVKEYKAQQNEWRGALNDATNRTASTSELHAASQTLEEKIAGLKERADRQDGALSGMQKIVVFVGGALGILVAATAYFSQKAPTFPDIKDVKIEGTAE